MTKDDEFGTLKDPNIVSYNFHRETKPRQTILLQKFYNHGISCILDWDCLKPFCEIISGCEYPLVLAIGRRMYFSYKI